jgi:hypothetical protein
MMFSLGFLYRLSLIWSMPDRWAYFGRLVCVVLGVFSGLSAWCLLAAPFVSKGTLQISEVIAGFLALLTLTPFLRLMCSHFEEGSEEKGWRVEWIESAGQALRTGFIIGLVLPGALAVLLGVFWLVGTLLSLGHGK